MKKKIVLVFLSVAVLLGLFLVLRKVIPYNAKPLGSPEGIVLEGYTISWGTVENATGYEVEVDGEIRAVKGVIPITEKPFASVLWATVKGI